MTVTPESNVQNDSENSENDPTRQAAAKTVYHIAVEPGGSFTLGENVFDVKTEKITFDPENGESTPEFISATSTYLGKPVVAKINLQSVAPWFVIQMDSENMNSPNLWSQIFFNKPYDLLAREQQSEVDKSVAGAMIPMMKELDSIESVDF